MEKSTVFDCYILQLPKVTNPAGNITAINEEVNLPFNISRVYYLYDLPAGEARGGHAHKNLYQLIIAVSGSFDVVISDSVNTKIISLNRPFLGLIVVPGIWRELVNFSSGAVCLVLASEHYDESDYIRDYEDFSLKKKI